MRALIYAGGEIAPANISEHPAEGDLTIAADSGWHNAALLGVTPAVLLGDFDSIGTEDLPEAAEILQLPPEKDRTDTQLAVSLALSRGAAEIVIIGGLSGRLDHTLSNVSLLEALAARGIAAKEENLFTILDDHNISPARLFEPVLTAPAEIHPVGVISRLHAGTGNNTWSQQVFEHHHRNHHQ